MAWKTKFVLGPKNLAGNAERLEALDAARLCLKAYGVDSATVEDAVAHEKDRLFAFPDYDESTGKKLKLVLQEDPNEGIRLSVILNRLHTKDDVKRSLGAVEEPSEGDLNFGMLNRFRRV